MASSLARDLLSSATRHSARRLPSGAAAASFSSSATKPREVPTSDATLAAEDIPTAGISRPLSEILKELGKKVPDSFIKVRMEENFTIKYIPWHIVNRILNLHAPEWSGEVRNIVYSPDGKTVTVVYRVTLYGTDAEHRIPSCYLQMGFDIGTGWRFLEDYFDLELYCFHIIWLVWVQIFRESCGTAAVDGPAYGDAIQTAEAMAFRRACARLGLGLHLYHEEL